MKRFISIIVALAMVLALGSALVAYADEPFRGYIDNGGEVSTANASPSGPSVTSFTIGKGTGSVSVSGWAISLAGVNGFKIELDGNDITSTCTISQGQRADVLGAFAGEGYNAENNPNPGVSISIPTKSLNNGDYSAVVYLVDGDDNEQELYDIDIYVEAGAEVVSEEAALKGKSLDAVYFDDDAVCTANAIAWLDNNYADRLINRTDEGFTSIALYGWVGYVGEIASFGYRIGDTDTFGDFFHETGSDVLGAGGANARRFTIRIPVGTIVDETRIDLIVKFTTDEVIVIQDFWVAIEGDANDLHPEQGGEQGGDTPSYTYRNASFDSFYVDGVLNFGEADGNASDKLDARSRRVGEGDGAIQELMLRGWIGFDQEIEAFGYKIGDAAPVYSADFFQATEEAVKGAGGEFAQRYCVTVPVAGIEGEQTIVMMVKLANGTEVAIDDQLEATGVATPPNTSFTFVGVPGQQPPAPTADASMIIFVVAAAAIALVVLKKKAF